MFELSIKKWLNFIQIKISVHTLRAYSQDATQFLNFLKNHFGKEIEQDDIKNLTVRDVRSWLSARQDSYDIRSTARAFSCIKNLFHFLILHKYIDYSPFDQMKAPKVKKLLPKPLSIEQAFDVIQNINENKEAWINKRNQAFFMLVYSVGLRIQEALNLNQNILDHDFFTVLGKGNKQRSLPLIENVKEKIQSYLSVCPYTLNKDAPLFYSQQGKRLSQGIMQKTLKTYRELYQLPDYATPHALRHSCATHLVDKTDNLRAVQDLLGHKSLSTTQIYTKISQTKIRKEYDKAHPCSVKQEEI
jgi:integrase/recombinase XerC